MSTNTIPNKYSQDIHNSKKNSGNSISKRKTSTLPSIPEVSEAEEMQQITNNKKHVTVYVPDEHLLTMDILSKYKKYPFDDSREILYLLPE